MGSTCGCIAREAEEEVLPFPSDIALARIFPSPFNDAFSEQIPVPIVDLEKKFTGMIDNLHISNSVVNVLLPFTHRLNATI